MIALKPPLGSGQSPNFSWKAIEAANAASQCSELKFQHFWRIGNPLLLALPIARAVFFFRCLECLLQTDHIFAGP
jgi:hypothetical protein